MLDKLLEAGGAMEYSEQQKEDLRRQYATRRRWLIIFNIVGTAAMVGMIVMEETKFRGTLMGISMSSDIVFGTLMAVVIAISVLIWLKWRCPSCNKWLGVNLGVDSCPKCGLVFNDFGKSHRSM